VSQTESGGRYERSASGLLIAMVVTVVAVGAFVVLRSLFSNDIEIEPEKVDYLPRVAEVQATGFEPVYPPSLPKGWFATDVGMEPGEPLGFRLNLLTADEKFVGLRQVRDDVDDLLEDYVDESTDEGDPFEVSGSVASTWETYSDDGGDLAYAAEVGEMIVLVYGSADREDLEQLVGSLTTRPLPSPAPSP
jgi:hypothetical protein